MGEFKVEKEERADKIIGKIKRMERGGKRE